MVVRIATTVIVLGSIALLLIWSTGRAAREASSRGTLATAPATDLAEETQGPTHVDSAGSRALVSGEEEPHVDELPPTAAPLDLLMQRIEQLEELDRTADDDRFMTEAPGIADGIAREALRVVPRAADVLVPLLNDANSSARLRGAFAIAAGWSCGKPLRPMLVGLGRSAPDLLVQQGAMIGLGASGNDTTEIYSTWDFFEESLSRNRRVFRARLARSSPGHGDDLPALLEIARNDDDLSCRETAVLVAGQDIDSDERVYSFCLSQLRGNAWRENHLAWACLFVLSHSARPEAATALLALARSMRANQEEQVESMEILGTLLHRHPSPEVIHAAIQSIGDRDLWGLGRGILMFELGDAAEGELAYLRAKIFDELGEVALTDPDHFAQVGAMVALVQSFGTDAMPVLENVFLHDTNGKTRERAAALIPEAADDDEAAFETLSSAWRTEQDPKTREKIVSAIARLSPKLALPFLRSVLASAPGGELERLAREALGRLEGN